MRKSAYRLAAGWLLAVAACSEIQDLVSTPPDELLTLIAARGSLPADGVATVLITARLSDAVGPEMRQVRFQASSGTLGGAACDSFGDCAPSVVVTASPDGVAVVDLRSPTLTGTAIVEARIGDTINLDGDLVPGPIARSVTVEFSRAYPERIDVQLEETAVEACFAASVEVVALLLRESGLPSEGTLVEFVALNGEVPIGAITKVTRSDHKGEASAHFSPGDTDHRGLVSIRARVTTASGTTIEGSARLGVTEPGTFSTTCD